MMFTAIQKISISIISVMCILMAVFGIFNKQSYNSITTDNSAFDNAVLYDYASFEEEENNFSENINVEYINDQLKNADTIFVGTVKDIKNQYECLRYTINIDKVVKGKNINISETVVLYEYSHFILNENNWNIFKLSPKIYHFKKTNNICFLLKDLNMKRIISKL